MLLHAYWPSLIACFKENITHPPFAGSVQLRNELASIFGVELPPTVTFDYPTPAALANFVAGQQHALPVPASLPVPVTPAGSLGAGDGEAVTEIVGLSCTYPGQAAMHSVAGFWDTAVSSADLPTVIPHDRWAIEARYSSDIRGG